MSTLDVVLRFCLPLIFMGLVAAAFFVRLPQFRVAMIVGLLAIVVLAEITLGPECRNLVSRRVREQKWTRDYSEGAVDMLNRVRAYRPYVVISAFGLAVFALRAAMANRTASSKK